MDEDSDIAYACPLNKQRNAVSASVFKDHLCNSGEFPDVQDDALPPMHTIIVEADIQSMKSCDKSRKTTVSPELRDRILSTCGDSNCTTSQQKKIDPSLRLYIGAHAMCIDNSRLKTENVGNGTMCRVRRLQLKPGSPPMQWKN
jgi:hypothetical protein